MNRILRFRASPWHRWTSARWLSSQQSSDSHPLVLQIWGANTGVGKTVLSAALLRIAEQPSLYLKPVQSGYPSDDDSRAVQSLAQHARGVTLHKYGPPVSPDLAASLEEVPPVSDAVLLEQTTHGLGQFVGTLEIMETPGRALAIIETAGGVLSPAPSGSLQADVYRPLRLPALLLGDATLGGVSVTLAAYEALRIRGYDVSAIVFFEQEGSELENEATVENVVQKDGTSVFQAPRIPPMEVPLSDYFRAPEVGEFFLNLYEHLQRVDSERFGKLKRMQSESKNLFWYPFTQHAKLDKVTCIDSASGDTYACYDPEYGLHSIVDGIGSWWTNGVGHGNPDMAKSIGRAAGRYGHVMFPEATYAPAFELAKNLLEGPGKGWAERVFYSDDGSTAVEVALKMAFRKRAVDFPDRTKLPVKIVGVDGCYHGDTLGVMDCAPSSVFNEKQTPWYEPRGVFFEPPTPALVNGVWQVAMPQWTGLDFDIVLSGREELFDISRTVPQYDQAIGSRLDATLESGIELGALLMEPVLQGAGGMRLVDPAFQRSLVSQCRLRGIPVIFDEVFTGLWRLGSESGGSLLGVYPDVGAFGKLLTGGTVPLAATLASEEVFSAFEGDSKTEALLHGHSYSGHAIGCAAGVEAMRQYEGLVEGKTREYWDEAGAGDLSCAEGVESVVVVGTVLAVRMRGEGEGYEGCGARKVVDGLREEDLFVRELGNVVYVMCTPLAGREVCDGVMRKMRRVLAGEGEGEGEGKRKEDDEEEEGSFD